jgi:hypothetical protein
MELLANPPSRTRIPARRCSTALLVVVLSAVLSGCQSPHAPSDPPPPRAGSAELILYIVNEPFVTAEPAYRAIFALAQGEAFTGEFGELTDKLREGGLIGKDWTHAADQCLDRATVAYMVCRACKIQSGVNWMLTGLGRYAWRELQYKGIAEGGSETTLMSGGEFVGVLSRAGEYLQRTGKAGEQNVQLGKAEGPH